MAILSFLLFAGLFFLMMKFGCGSHMSHGHKSNEEDTNTATTYDPVCGLKINENEGYGKLLEGELYRFCSMECLQKFDKNAGIYAANSNKIKQLEQEHLHES